MRNAVKSNWFPISSGLACFTWAFLAWLTVIPNQDLLADGIQVQSLISDPRIVLAFPGQKHGGVFEYPYNVLAEWVAPGNYFLESALRPVFAFLTGFFAAKLYLTYFPRGPRWSFLLAVAVGPTILHGLAGPEGNSVGVWWLNANYDLAWLFVIFGFWVIGRELSQPTARQVPRTGMLFLGGLLLGLGFYQQPTSILLIIPIGVLTVLRFRIQLREILLILTGGVIGILPSMLSYFFAPVTTWNPSHFPVFQPKVAISSLGLDGIPNYVAALFPSALGFGPASTHARGLIQSSVTAGFLMLMLLCALVGIVISIRSRARVSYGTSIAITWISAAAAIVFFGVFVDPVWFYSAHLALILWISVGLLPVVVKPKWLGFTLTSLVLLAIAYSTVGQNFGWYSEMWRNHQAKREYLSSITSTANKLKLAGADYLYGSYYDVIPLGYGSGGALRAITNTYNRFPLSERESNSALRVAVRTDPTDDWGRQALDQINSVCEAENEALDSTEGRFVIYECLNGTLLPSRE
jgi:hypothetical protein